MVCRIKKIEHLDSLIKLDVLDLHGNEVSLVSMSILFSMSMLSKNFSRDDASDQQHIAFVLSCPLFISALKTFLRRLHARTNYHSLLYINCNGNKSVTNTRAINLC